MKLLDHAQPNGPKILVIGAGVAGCAFAIRLRQHGVDVDVVEKELFRAHHLVR